MIYEENHPVLIHDYFHFSRAALFIKTKQNKENKWQYYFKKTVGSCQ